MDIADKRKREYFGKRFSELLEKWEKTNNGTMKSFAAAAGVSRNIVTAWKQGKRFPRDAQMMKICDVFGIDQRAFMPFFPLERDLIDNSDTEEWSQQLQLYANEKGLDEKWYQYFISKPYFLSRFPFERPVCNIVDAGFDLVKFEFVDDAGNRIRMTESDIDFMIKVQNKSDALIDYQMYRQRERYERKRVEENVDIWLKPYKGIDKSDVLSRLYAVDLSKTEQRITDKEIFEAIEQTAKEKGIHPHYSKADIAEMQSEAHVLHNDEWKKTMREWGRINGREEEAERKIREALEFDMRAYASMIEKLKQAGLLDEETEV